MTVFFSVWVFLFLFIFTFQSTKKTETWMMFQELCLDVSHASVYHNMPITITKEQISSCLLLA